MFPTEKENDDPTVLSIPASCVPAQMNSPFLSPWNIRENMLLTNYKTANLFHQTPEMNANPKRFLSLTSFIFLIYYHGPKQSWANSLRSAYEIINRDNRWIYIHLIRLLSAQAYTSINQLSAVRYLQKCASAGEIQSLKIERNKVSLRTVITREMWELILPLCSN